MLYISIALSLMITPVGGLTHQDRTPDLQQLEKCSRLISDLKRLSCYDKILAVHTNKGTEVPKSKFGLSKKTVGLTKPKQPKMSSNPQSSNEPVTMKMLLDTFLKKDSNINRITVEISSHRKSSNGAYTFTMEDGSIWQQTDASRRIIQDASFTATISKGNFKSFNLKPKTKSWSMRVKRIK